MGKKQEKDRKPKSAELGWVYGRENHRIKAGQEAQTSDRQDRAAWPSLPRRSAYIHLVNLPDHVAAGDTVHARAIMDRLDRAIDQGGWTTNEFNRLRAMRKAWARRQAGQDVVFNMRGWQHKGGGHNLPPTLKALKEIKDALDI